MVVLFLEVIFYRVCIQEYFQLVLYWEVYPLLECHLSAVSLYRCRSCRISGRGGATNRKKNCIILISMEFGGNNSACVHVRLLVGGPLPHNALVVYLFRMKP